METNPRLVIVNRIAFELPALGRGSVTLTFTLLAEVRSAAGSFTRIEVGLIEEGIRTLEPKFTTAPLINPVPVMVSELRSPLPTNAIGGESLVMVIGLGDAEICAVPVDIPLARPLASMTTEGLLEVQENEMPLMADPF